MKYPPLLQVIAQIDVELSKRFYEWELRGRGWQIFDRPVVLEPPFAPSPNYYTPPKEIIDDGYKPTGLSKLVERISQRLSPAPKTTEDETDRDEDDPSPESLIRTPLVEFEILIPLEADIPSEVFRDFILSISLCRKPISFELVGQSSGICLQLAMDPDDASLLRRQLRVFFPSITVVERRGLVERSFSNSGEVAVVEFGLAKEFLVPLHSGKIDPLPALTGALSDLAQSESGIYQVLLNPAHEAWPGNILRSVTHEDGKPMFANAEKLVDSAKKKISHPLYAAVVRVAARSEDFSRSWEIISNMAGALAVFAHPLSNELLPLQNTNYPLENHIEDVIRRQTRRAGMILNLEELIGFVHWPSKRIQTDKFKRITEKTKEAPPTVKGKEGALLGLNLHAGHSSEIRLTPEQRVRHIHIIGASGTGKSTLLFNLICQDIDSGQGIAVLDPHGDLIDQILDIIPKERLEDVLLLDPSDEEYSVGFNILAAHSDVEKRLLASDLTSVFQRLSTSWGDQMGSVLRNAILAFLESSGGGTLLELRHFLLDRNFRQKFLETVSDPEVRYYWRHSFPQLGGNKSLGPILTRLETFLAPKTIRYMVSQRESKLDFLQILETKKIFLAKLAQGAIGRENSYLLGSLLVTKLHQAAMSRQRIPAPKRTDFWLYVDEFHHFITPSVSDLLAAARKYRVGLILAHQDLHQLSRDKEVESAVLTNTSTRICFRLGDADAKFFSGGFSYFTASDLQNLKTGEAFARVDRSSFDFNLSVPRTERMSDEIAGRRNEVVSASRNEYATLRAEVERSMSDSALEMERGAIIGKKTKTLSPKTLDPDVNKVEPPQARIVPDNTIVSIVPPALEVSDKKPSPIPLALGRGGAQHKAIQERIAKAARVLGFQAVLEQPILEAQAFVDILLRRESLFIACNVAVTTTVDHEIRNIQSCQKAGFEQIAILSSSEDRLRKIREAAQNTLGPNTANLLHFFLPDEFLKHLETISWERPQASVTSHGYKIKRTFVNLSPEEAKAREATALNTLSEFFQKKKRANAPVTNLG